MVLVVAQLIAERVSAPGSHGIQTKKRGKASAFLWSQQKEKNGREAPDSHGIQKNRGKAPDIQPKNVRGGPWCAFNRKRRTAGRPLTWNPEAALQFSLESNTIKGPRFRFFFVAATGTQGPHLSVCG